MHVFWRGILAEAVLWEDETTKKPEQQLKTAVFVLLFYFVTLFCKLLISCFAELGRGNKAAVRKCYVKLPSRQSNPCFL